LMVASMESDSELTPHDVGPKPAWMGYSIQRPSLKHTGSFTNNTVALGHTRWTSDLTRSHSE
jgi:hypothetical protein